MNSALAQSIADLSNRWHNRFSRWRKSSESGHLRRGARGERLARRYLKRNGYKVLFCNFRGRTGGEIDVVCRDNDTLVFVEVRLAAAKILGGLSKQLIEKNESAFLVGLWPGCECWIIPIFSSDSTLLR